MRTALLCIAALLLFTKGAFAQLPAFPDSLKNTVIAGMQEGDSLVIIEAHKVVITTTTSASRTDVSELTDKNRRIRTHVIKYRINRLNDSYTITFYRLQKKKFPNKTIKHISAKKSFYTWEQLKTIPLRADDVLKFATYCHNELRPIKPVNVDEQNFWLMVLLKNREPRKLVQPLNNSFSYFMQTMLAERHPELH